MRSLMTQGFNTALWILVDYVTRDFDWMMSSNVIQSLEANQKYLNNFSKTPPKFNQRDSFFAFWNSIDIDVYFLQKSPHWFKCLNRFGYNKL